MFFLFSESALNSSENRQNSERALFSAEYLWDINASYQTASNIAWRTMYVKLSRLNLPALFLQYRKTKRIIWYYFLLQIQYPETPAA